jgi:IS5 family transposase
MIPKKADSRQMIFCLTFEVQPDHSHSLYFLADKIDCQIFEAEFSKQYNPDQGRSAKPIRLLIGLLLLKHIRILSEESVVEQWQEYSYYQYFCSLRCSVTVKPCDPNKLVHVRNRIRTPDMELVLKESISLNGKDGKIKRGMC